MKRVKIQYNGIQVCPSCKDPGIVWQPYGMKCVFCGYCQYFKRSNKACTRQKRAQQNLIKFLLPPFLAGKATVGRTAQQKGNMLDCRIHKGTLLQNWTRYASAGTVTSLYCPICSPELRAEHLHTTQQSVQRIAFGKGGLARLGNLFIRLGWWLASLRRR